MTPTDRMQDAWARGPRPDIGPCGRAQSKAASSRPRSAPLVVLSPSRSVGPGRSNRPGAGRDRPRSPRRRRRGRPPAPWCRRGTTSIRGRRRRPPGATGPHDATGLAAAFEELDPDRVPADVEADRPAPRPHAVRPVVVDDHLVADVERSRRRSRSRASRTPPGDVDLTGPDHAEVVAPTRLGELAVGPGSRSCRGSRRRTVRSRRSRAAGSAGGRRSRRRRRASHRSSSGSRKSESRTVTAAGPDHAVRTDGVEKVSVPRKPAAAVAEGVTAVGAPVHDSAAEPPAAPIASKPRMSPSLQPGPMSFRAASIVTAVSS